MCNNIIWSIGRKGEIYYREGVTKDNPAGSNWKLIESPKCSFPFTSKISVYGKALSLTNHAAWVLLSNGAIAVRTDISKEQPIGRQWKYLSGNSLLMLVKTFAQQG